VNDERCTPRARPSRIGAHHVLLRGALVWSILSIFRASPPQRTEEYPPFPPCLVGDDIWTDTKCWGVILRCTDKCGLNRPIGSDVVHWSRTYTCGGCIGFPW
jgi:hypothetical protein